MYHDLFDELPQYLIRILRTVPVLCRKRHELLYPNQFEASYAHNHGQWKAQELTDLINKLNQEDGTDFAARWTHLGEANSHLIDNAVVVPLEQEVKGYLVNPALKGYITHQLGSAAFDLTRAYFEE